MKKIIIYCLIFVLIFPLCILAEDASNFSGSFNKDFEGVINLD